MITLFAVFLGGVGTLMQPTPSEGITPVSPFVIVTEASVVITTEAGQALRTE